jgi:hypothetical protein
LRTVFGTHASSVSVEDRVVCDLHLIIDVQQLLDVLVVILHVVSLPDITDHPCIKPFSQKFQVADSECVSGLKVMELSLEKHFIEPTAFFSVKLHIFEHYSPSNFVIFYRKVLSAYFVALKGLNSFFLACFLVWVAFSEYNRHFFSI